MGNKFKVLRPTIRRPKVDGSDSHLWTKCPPKKPWVPHDQYVTLYEKVVDQMARRDFIRTRRNEGKEHQESLRFEGEFDDSHLLVPVWWGGDE